MTGAKGGREVLTKDPLPRGLSDAGVGAFKAKSDPETWGSPATSLSGRS